MTEKTRATDPRANKNLVIRLYKEGLVGDPRGLNRFFAPNFRDHLSGGDLAVLKATIQTIQEAFPSVRWRVEQCIAEGDRVAVRAVMTVRNALGTVKTSSSTSIYRVQNGKIIEHWGNREELHLGA